MLVNMNLVVRLHDGTEQVIPGANIATISLVAAVNGQNPPAEQVARPDRPVVTPPRRQLVSQFVSSATRQSPSGNSTGNQASSGSLVARRGPY